MRILGFDARQANRHFWNVVWVEIHSEYICGITTIRRKQIEASIGLFGIIIILIVVVLWGVRIIIIIITVRVCIFNPWRFFFVVVVVVVIIVVWMECRHGGYGMVQLYGRFVLKGQNMVGGRWEGTLLVILVSVEIIFKFQNFARNLTALGSFIFIHRFLDLLLAQQAEILDTVLL